MAILHNWQIDAAAMFGPTKRNLELAGVVSASQRCVCFSETPLEYVHLLLQDIDNRQVQFEPYGIAFPKKIGRVRGVNPVWYVDITRGHDWLMQPVNDMIEAALDKGGIDAAPIGRLAPFIEQMGTQFGGGGNVIYRKEFWWEREWRRVGNFVLPGHVIVLCPEAEFAAFGTALGEQPGHTACFIDPHWGLEQIISRSAEYVAADSDIL
jgi:hypothetical protein